MRLVAFVVPLWVFVNSMLVAALIADVHRTAGESLSSPDEELTLVEDEKPQV